MIFFDLDGTLVDTAPDLAHALNLQRARHGLPPLPQEAIRPYASHGSKGLLAVGFNCTPQDAAFAAKREEYLAIYNEVFTRSPVLFDGMEIVLRRLEDQGPGWGIVTNKPRRFAEPLIDALQLAPRARCLVCADDAARPKPFPDPLLLACDIAAVAPAGCVYVGDAERDIEAGRAAGMRTVVALFGYIADDERPDEWGADAMIRQPQELLQLI